MSLLLSSFWRSDKCTSDQALLSVHCGCVDAVAALLSDKTRFSVLSRKICNVPRIGVASILSLFSSKRSRVRPLVERRHLSDSNLHTCMMSHCAYSVLLLMQYLATSSD